MKIYNEKEQAQQIKIQNVQIEKRGTRKWNRAKSCVQGDKQIKKWNKGSGDLRARSHPAKFPTCEKELKKNLEPSVVVHAFIPRTDKAEVSRYLKASLVYRASSRTVQAQEVTETMENRKLVKVSLKKGAMFQPQ